MGGQGREKFGIRTYDCTFVRDTLAARSLLEGEDMDAIEFEFRRFIKLVSFERGPLAVIDLRVDEFWHTFILSTAKYREFCRDCVGFFVDHVTNTTTTPVPIQAVGNFTDAYLREFGEFPSFWTERLSPADIAQLERREPPSSLTFLWSGWPGREGCVVF